MKTWAISCTLLNIIEAETEEEAREKMIEYLDTEFISSDNFNDIEVSPLQW